MAATKGIAITIEQERLPRYDPAHGTPDPMSRRVATLILPLGEATFEQTDYGHPGRFNPWEPRGIDEKLRQSAPALRAICESLEAFLD